MRITRFPSCPSVPFALILRVLVRRVPINHSESIAKIVWKHIQ
uniref:Uncharacterized protein n=1 Tax=Schistosoma mansoni TaxID=6183 RepID=A0AA82N7Y0_SCHMA